MMTNEQMARAQELLTTDMVSKLETAAGLTAMLAAAQETSEEFETFLNGAFKAIYNDGRNKAGKENDDTFDGNELVTAVMLGTLMGMSPIDSLFGALATAYIEGHDSE